MKSRFRLLGAIRGEPIDCVPWSPFLAYYWESLPKEIQARGQFEYMRGMGADPLLRGFHRLTRCAFKNCDIEEKRMGKELSRSFRTPVGTLTERYVYSENGDTSFLVDHPVVFQLDQVIGVSYVINITVLFPGTVFVNGLVVVGDLAELGVGRKDLVSVQHGVDHDHYDADHDTDGYQTV